MNVIFIIFLIVLTSLFDTINQILLKSSINGLEIHIKKIGDVIVLVVKLLKIPRVWLGFTFCCLSLIIWLFVLSKADLNFAFSADSMHYIFIALTSRHILKEKVGLERWLGTAFIIAGIILITDSNSY